MVLKIWAYALAGVGLLLYLIGIFSGEFTSHFGGIIYWGSSSLAMLFSILSAVCILLSITSFITVHTIKNS